MLRKRLLVAVVGAYWAAAGHVCAADVNVENEARKLVTKALEAEAAGDVSKHAALLGDAVAADPNFRLARWCRGELLIGDQWKAIADVQAAAAADPARGEYLQRREAATGSLARQIELARWCRKQAFDDEARFHWATVLTHDPNNEAALRALGVRWHNGWLMTPDEVAAAKEQQQAFQAAAEEFRPQVARWDRMLSAGDLKSRREALAEIRALRGPHAIAALEELTLVTSLSSNSQFERCLDVSEAIVAALDDTPGPAATGSLLRHAVLSPLKSVREKSIAALEKRPPHDYLPQLLGALAMPIESSYRIVTDSDGSVHYFHSIFREGPASDWSFDGRFSAMQHDLRGPTFLTINDFIRKQRTDIRFGAANNPAIRAEMSAYASANQRGLSNVAADAEGRVAAINRSIAVANGMIYPVLKAVTGEDFADNPRAWWDWWTEYNEYVADGPRPVDESQYADSSHRYYRQPSEKQISIHPPSPPMRIVYIQVPKGTPGNHLRTCFAAGTPVWTKCGLAPIETIKIGDFVLAQDVESGELKYKPVIGLTQRPASDCNRLTTGTDKIDVTLGHPLWVAGRGWRMAKELADGEILHGVTGPVRVDTIEPQEEAEAYNLVVADFNTYFVGKSGILVHDNTPRRPTTAVVPGLASLATSP